jgi:hypothetical protein
MLGKAGSRLSLFENKMITFPYAPATENEILQPCKHACQLLLHIMHSRHLNVPITASCAESLLSTYACTPF